MCIGELDGIIPSAQAYHNVDSSNRAETPVSDPMKVIAGPVFTFIYPVMLPASPSV